MSDDEEPFIDPLIGRVVGSYTIEERIGEGGMCVVYRATKRPAGRVVALKILRRQWTDDPHTPKRFLREARISASLSNPNTVAIYDFGEAEGGTLFIAMELLEGSTLATLLRPGAALPPAMAADIAEQMCLSLIEAHGKGIVHRDLKPENIFLESQADGTRLVKVLDYGLARVIEAGSELQVHTVLTRIGTIMGTPAYMSPEQARGDPVDARTDLFSLGVVLYEMVTGRRPFVDRNPQRLIEKLKTEPPPPLDTPGVAPDLEKLILQLLEKDPEARPPSARSVCSALRAVLDLPQPLTKRKAPAAADGAEVVQPLVRVKAGAASTDSEPRTLVKLGALGAPIGVDPQPFVGLHRAPAALDGEPRTLVEQRSAPAALDASGAGPPTARRTGEGETTDPEVALPLDPSEIEVVVDEPSSPDLGRDRMWPAARGAKDDVPEDALTTWVMPERRRPTRSAAPSLSPVIIPSSEQVSRQRSWTWPVLAAVGLVIVGGAIATPSLFRSSPSGSLFSWSGDDGEKSRTRSRPVRSRPSPSPNTSGPPLNPQPTATTEPGVQSTPIGGSGTDASATPMPSDLGDTDPASSEMIFEAPPADDPESAGGVWSGTYQCERGTLRLVRRGDRVNGFFGTQSDFGRFWGRLEGDTLEFRWTLSGAVDDPHSGGRGFLRPVDGPNGVRLEGTYGYGERSTGAGAWTAVR